ncbi:hypothetical protein [Oscillatoria acuminata]|uniref:hypothetical protein n=1 Tax=Oscillatoria acuminata TaxID=118323 RepID=UPI0002EAEC32|nr:hypothetical protein [Oscillatoria acuminata]
MEPGANLFLRDESDRLLTTDTLHPLLLPNVAIATSGGPHPNPPLAKGRGPEV